jgi:hypothetical protein
MKYLEAGGLDGRGWFMGTGGNDFEMQRVGGRGTGQMRLWSQRGVRRSLWERRGIGNLTVHIDKHDCRAAQKVDVFMLGAMLVNLSVERGK